MVAADIDTAGLRSFENDANVEILEVDLEAETWPLEGRTFDGIVVTNYLYRPRLLKLVDALSRGGVLIYETFAKGNEAYGRPTNPDYLLNPAELLEVFSTSLTVIAYEHGIDEEPHAGGAAAPLCTTKRVFIEVVGEGQRTPSHHTRRLRSRTRAVLRLQQHLRG